METIFLSNVIVLKINYIKDINFNFLGRYSFLLQNFMDLSFVAKSFISPNRLFLSSTEDEQRKTISKFYWPVAFFISFCLFSLSFFLFYLSYAHIVDRMYRAAHQSSLLTLHVRHRSNPLFENIISSTYERTKLFHLRIRLKSKRTMASSKRHVAACTLLVLGKITLPIPCHVFVTFTRAKSTNFFNVTVFLLSNYEIVYHREIATKWFLWFLLKGWKHSTIQSKKERK